MGMTIDEDIEMLEYIRQDFRGCRQGVALQDAIGIMHKYQQIVQIIKDHDADRIPEDYWYIDKIREVIEDGNVDN